LLPGELRFWHSRLHSCLVQRFSGGCFHSCIIMIQFLHSYNIFIFCFCSELNLLFEIFSLFCTFFFT
jgi:hypothetical protein